MIAPVAFCLNCNRAIYDRYPYENSNEDGEPSFCCKKCEDEYIQRHGQPLSWKPAYLY
jgi:hypothetical protein